MLHSLILCPLYKDEQSFNVFAAKIEEEKMNDHRFSFLVVNDGSGPIQINTKLPLTVIHLHRNLGHQKAIAIGLSYAQEKLVFDNIIVMDCDGEDSPSDIKRLTHTHISTKKMVVAARTSRKEGRNFLFFYFLYKTVFSILTGKKISFGNFMLIPRENVARLVHYGEIWNHLAGSIIKSKTEFIAVPSHRGKRYHGRSKMNFNSLLLHGLGALGVFIDVIATRLLVFSLSMILVSLLAIVVILFLKFFTETAIPGWATSAISSMLIILLQSCLLSLFTIFLYMSSQGQRKFIPAHHYSDFIHSVNSSGNA